MILVLVIGFSLPAETLAESWGGFEATELLDEFNGIFESEMNYARLDVVYAGRTMRYLLVVDALKAQGFIVEVACHDNVVTAVADVTLSPPIYELSDSSGGVATQRRLTSALGLLEQAQLVRVTGPERVPFACDNIDLKGGVE